MIIAFGLDHHKQVDSYQRALRFPYWTLQIILEGEAILTASGETRTFPAGTLLSCPPNHRYTYELNAGSSEIWCIFTPRMPFASIMQAWPETMPGLRLIEAKQWINEVEIMPLLKKALAIWRTDGTQAPLLAENFVERTVLLVDKTLQDASRPPLDDRVSKAALFISTHFKSPLHLPVLAAHVHMSPSRLSHLLRQQLGKSPQELLTKYRMDEAIHLLLSTNMRVNEVSTEIGYPDPFYFCKRFTRYTGLSPRAFRQTPHPADLQRR